MKRRKPRASKTCYSPRLTTPHTFEEVVASYRSHEKQNADEEWRFFSKKSLPDAVHTAALSMNSGGHRHAHQRRLQVPTLREAERRLLAALPQLKRCANFHELFLFVRELMNDIRGLGELYVYDTALHIGAALGLEPQYVYLHRGTRAGARALGCNHRAHWLEVSELPEPLRVLGARELEDVLCIYKDVFASISPATAGGS